MQVYDLEGKFTKTRPRGTKIVSTRMEGGTKVFVVQKKNVMVNAVCILLLLASLLVVVMLNNNKLHIEFDDILKEDNGLVQIGLVNKKTSNTKVYIEVYNEEGILLCKSPEVGPGESIGYLPLLANVRKGESLIVINYNITVGNKMRYIKKDSVISVRDGGKL